ncbi:DUF937 domain-containing protein [Flavobacterium channae]|uniref:DUF937 domain-containing protein n=1 Tax=Flavobacterium channae TaxID=2897181 RepID=UPI001E52CE67|nr:DUF937 domain-containing protein [Flavobacterium channae]UGS24424.1 DUF937 domain-containing protein [Flavobacterium channae]
MFDQLSELVKQFGNDAVVNNPAVPNEQNDAVMNEAGSSILSGLKDMVANGNINDLSGLLSGNSAINANNPVVKQLTDKVTGNLGEKFGLSSDAAGSVAGGLIPQILGGLVNKAKDPNQPGFNMSDLVSAISGGQGGGLMDAVSKYGGQFGLDQNNDGKVDMGDITSAVSKKGGLGGLLGKLFGK